MQKSLWLLPVQASAGPLDALLSSTAQRFAGPEFAAHVTLRGKTGLSTEAQLEFLAAQFLPLSIECGAIVKGDSYFRCVYCEMYPSPGLLSLRVAAGEREPDSSLRKIEESRRYDPHLSLYYGEPPQSQHDAIQQSLSRQFNIGSLTFDGLAIINTADKDVNKWTKNVEVRSLKDQKTY